ncbi:carbon starvation protein A [uncultured Acetobacteroides sp.]|uniref:carbon starvation CstA family protein n=1 Tax=uncultured Acetobacteroides sp. TaxID=1760811 RepID=UPI0029F4D6F6|nr:carbon starvation protein A [uncultured Acetobacteroides sp.]
MNAMPLVIAALAIFALAYRFYFGFMAAKVLTLNDSIATPSGRLYDGQNYFPITKWVLFGHHFAAIAGAGPLVGPVLACQFGFFPGFLWMLVGAVMAGAVHDIVILTASVRNDGKSLVEIVRSQIRKTGSVVTATIATFVIIIIAMAGLGLVVVNALAESSWGTFTIASTIPIAILMGVWMYVFRKGKTVEATVIGVILLSGAVIFGRFIPGSPFESWFTFDRKQLTIVLALYGFVASVLPVWLLLSPRDYLSSIMKLFVIGMLAVGIIVVAPDLRMPAFTAFIHGGGPIIKGPLFPYLFITIACGAISGFHALISSGTTPKMVMKESHIRPIAAGAMLAEGVVSILALIAAASLFPLDYFQINLSPEKYQELLPQLHAMGFSGSDFQRLSQGVGENIAGRTGGAVTLAVGMAEIFSRIPGMDRLMSYWYHFAIMFEALFILTTIDAGTRIARFLLQDIMGKVYKPFGKSSSLPGNLIASALVVFFWGYFIYTGSVSTIWPMFGTANQLLATIALAVGTTYLINQGQKRYAWITLVPMAFVGVTTIYAGALNTINLYIPQVLDPATFTSGLINLLLTGVILISVVVIIADALPIWIRAFRGKAPLLAPVDLPEDAQKQKAEK